MSKRTLLIVLMVLIPVAYFATAAYGKWKLEQDFPFLKAQNVDIGPRPYDNFSGIIIIKDGVPIKMVPRKKAKNALALGNATA